MKYNLSNYLKNKNIWVHYINTLTTHKKNLKMILELA